MASSRHSADFDNSKISNSKIVLNRRSWNYKKKGTGTSGGEVVELRQQLRQLTDELHSLRTNLRGSVPDFMNHSGFSDNTEFLSPITASTTETPIKEKFIASITPAKEEEPEDEKPPLPPRLYRPPQKPERTFQQELCTDLSRVLHQIDRSSNHSLSSGHPQIATSMPVFGGARRPIKCTDSTRSGWKFNSGTAAIHEDNGFNVHSGQFTSYDPMNATQSSFAPPPQASRMPARRFASNGSLNSTGIETKRQQNGFQSNQQTNGVSSQNPPPLPPKTGLRNSPASLRVSMPQLMPPMMPQRGSRMFQSIRENQSSNQHSKFFNGANRLRPNPNSPFIPYKPTQSPAKPIPPVQCKSLANISPPLTLNSVVHEIKDSFESGTCWFDLGPITLFLNPFNDIGSSVTLTSVRECPPPVVSICKRLHEGFRHSEISQSVVVSGASSSGKSYMCMQLLRQLYVQFGGRGSREAPAFTTLAAATTVLRSLTCAQVDANEGSTQTAFLYEMHIIDDVPAKTKLFCCFTDLSRLTRQIPQQGNFNIFHEMLSGLTLEEKVKFHLTSANDGNLRYLNKSGQSPPKRDPCRDQQRFLDWTQSLSALGIPFSDVMRLLAAVLLLGNVEFVEGFDGEIELKGQKDLESVAALLGISGLSLYKTFTRRAKVVRNHEIESETTADYANRSRDALSQSLYYRCVSAIVRRANSIKCGACVSGSNGGVSSSDGESSSVQDSGIGMTQPNNAVDQSPTSSGQLNSSKTSSQQTEGIVSVLDMFGESTSESNSRHNLFDDLCKNIAIEKMQNFFQTQVFDRTKELILDEGIETLMNDAEFTFANDSLDLLYLPNSGLLCILDDETISPSLSPNSFTQSLQKSCKGRKCLEISEDLANFSIRHYGNRPVTYDPSLFIQTNTDQLPTDLARIFTKHSCNFGFASYFFSNDLKIMEETKPEDVRHSLRIMGSCGAENSGQNGFTAGATLMQDFTNQIHTFIQALSSTKPHFIHCIKPNNNCEYRKFDESVVKSQVQRLDIMPTLNLIGQGFPYYKTINEFNNRYRFLAIKYHHDMDFESNHIEETKLILDCYLKAVDDSDLPYVSNQWSLGHKHVFLSQGAFEQLEVLKRMYEKEADCKRRISHLPEHTVPNITSWLQHSAPQPNTTSSPDINNRLDRPKPMVDLNGSCDKVLKKATSMLGIDMNSTSPPPLPATRQYIVNGEKKLNFPQRRVLVEGYRDAINSVQIKSGEVLTAIGCASKSKHILVDLGKGKIIPIPTCITRLSTK